MRFKICINRALNLKPEINICKGGKIYSWWESEMEHEAYETAMPQAHTIIFSIPMAKQRYCSNNIFCWKTKQKKTSVKLLPIYWRIYCIRAEHVLLIAKRSGSSPRVYKRSASREIVNKAAHLYAHRIFSSEVAKQHNVL